MKSLLFFILMCFVFPAGVQAAETGALGSKEGLNGFEGKMVGKIWVTTEAIDQSGASVPAADERVAVYFGNAEYFPGGKFNMTTPDGQPKMHGLWSLSEDGKTRTLTVLDDQGRTRFIRTVENVKVEDNEYTYRIYPEEGKTAVYIDIVHHPK